MGDKRQRCVVLIAIGLLAMPLAFPATAGTYGTLAVYQASGTPGPPADGGSPFTSCDVSGFLTPGETNYLNTEVSPWVAVNPTDPTNIIGVYQQDAFSSGGGRGLVAAVSHNSGQTWAATFPPFSICAGGNASNGGDFQRVREPKVTFSPNGVAYFMGRPSNPVGGTRESAVLVSKSTDGGDHWSQPITLVRTSGNVGPFYSNLRSSITADPFDSSYVYAVWQRSRMPGEAESLSALNSSAFRGDLMFSRTTDGGQTWEAPKAIVLYRDNSGTYSNRFAVLADGTLAVIFDNVQAVGHDSNQYDIKLIRSTDRGVTWSDPIEVGPERSTVPVDPDTGRLIRVDLGRPDLAVDFNPSSPGYGNIYAVWGDRLGSPRKTPYSTVVFTESTDGGLTWSPMIKVNQSPVGVQAILPAIAVASDGTVAVTYDDYRNNTPAPGVPTDLWMIHCHASAACTNPANWSESHVAGSFDLEQAPYVGGYYLGDYSVLTSAGTTFLPFFTQTTATDQANTYLGIIVTP